MGGGELFTGVNADASETVAVINSDGSASFASGGFAIAGSGTVQTNIHSAGTLTLDSTGDFNDPNIFLTAPYCAALFSGSLFVDEHTQRLAATPLSPPAPAGVRASAPPPAPPPPPPTRLPPRPRARSRSPTAPVWRWTPTAPPPAPLAIAPAGPRRGRMATPPGTL